MAVDVMWGSQLHINFVNISNAYLVIHHIDTIAMRFTQQIIATFALFSILAYAEPMRQLKVPGLLVTREPLEAKWCGGLDVGECQEHCTLALGSNAKYKCNAR